MYKLGIAVGLAITLGGCALFQPPQPAPAVHHQVVRRAAADPVKPAIAQPAQVQPTAATVAPPKPSFRQGVLNSLVRQRAVK